MDRLTGIRPISISLSKADSKFLQGPKKTMVFRFRAKNQWRWRDFDISKCHLPLKRRWLIQQRIVSVVA